MCRALRQNKGHAVQDVKQQIRRFLAERQAENRPFEPEPLLEIEIEAPNGA